MLFSVNETRFDLPALVFIFTSKKQTQSPNASQKKFNPNCPLKHFSTPHVLLLLFLETNDQTSRSILDRCFFWRRTFSNWFRWFCGADPAATRWLQIIIFIRSPGGEENNQSQCDDFKEQRKRRSNVTNRSPGEIHRAQHRFTSLASGGHFKIGNHRHVHASVPNATFGNCSGYFIQEQIYTRILPPLRRARSGRGRDGKGVNARRRGGDVVQRPLHALRERRDAVRGDGGADGEIRRRVERDGREHAHVSTRGAFLWRERDCGRTDADWSRVGVRVQV